MKKITFLLFTLISISFFGQNKLTSSLNESYDGTNWTNSSRRTYVYDNNKNVTEEKYYDWDNTNSSWLLRFQETFTYNSANKLLVSTYQDYDSSGNIYDGSRDTYTYNSSNQIIDTVSEELDNGVWVKEEKRIFTYTGNKITEFIRESWNGTSWVLVIEDDDEDQRASLRLIISYGANGLVSGLIFEEWNGTSWVLDSKETQTYNTNNKILEILNEDWNGASYDVSSKEEFTYDANGNLILEEELTFDNGSFTTDSSTSYTFDTTQMLSGFSHPFDKDKLGYEALRGINNVFVNKILSDFSSDSRTTYNYNEATASVNDFNVIDFSVYPNPTTSTIKIDDINFSIKNIELYSIIGKKVLHSIKNELNLQHLVNGVYLLKIETESGKFVTKRIIKN